MIRFENVSKIYNQGGVGGEEVRALDRANLHIREGEFVSVVGPSGSGKSTLMHIMGCLDIATEGTYRLDGQPIDYYTENDLASVRGHKIGFVFQSFNLIGRMSIEDNVELPLVYLGIKPAVRRELVERALALVGLTDRRKHRPNTISGGQQQRAAIARAVVTDPSLILADEPTGNLDSHTGKEIMEHFHALNRAGKTIVLITHDAGIASLANRTVSIMDGRIVSDSGEPAGLGSGESSGASGSGGSGSGGSYGAGWDSGGSSGTSEDSGGAGDSHMGKRSEKGGGRQ
jgi:putative ABC transport system ATP-binding protein